MKKLLLLLFTFLFTSYSFACLNYYYGVDGHGHTHVYEGKTPAPAFNKNFNLISTESKLVKLLPTISEKGDYKLLSDYAVLLLKGGKHKLALDVMQILYHNHPDEYQLAANLGTAFEINGNLDSAIFYINRGMELNPDAHEGSEWVHIKVLETKAKLITDPSYLTSNSVLNLSEEDKENEAIRNQIQIQVQERFPFTAGPDPIMASILIDLADCYKQTKSIEFAAAIYKLSNSYYGADITLVKAKTQIIDSLRNAHAQIKLKHGEVEGYHEHADFIKEQKLKEYKVLDDNNENGYAIDWMKVNTNLEELIAMVGLSMLPEPIILEVEEIKTTEKTEVTEEVTKKDSPSNFVFYLLMGVLIIILIAVFVKLRKAK